MGIYDKEISVYDNLDCLENDSSVDEIDPNDLNDAKSEVSAIDDKLKELIEYLADTVNDPHTDGELTIGELNEFLEEGLPSVIEDLEKIRGRLY